MSSAEEEENAEGIQTSERGMGRPLEKLVEEMCAIMEGGRGKGERGEEKQCAAERSSVREIIIAPQADGFRYRNRSRLRRAK